MQVPSFPSLSLSLSQPSDTNISSDIHSTFFCLLPSSSPRQGDAFSPWSLFLQCQSFITARRALRAGINDCAYVISSLTGSIETKCRGSRPPCVWGTSRTSLWCGITFLPALFQPNLSLFLLLDLPHLPFLSPPSLTTHSTTPLLPSCTLTSHFRALQPAIPSGERAPSPARALT